MSERIEVRYLTGDGTVLDEDPVTADRATVQHRDSGQAVIRLYRDGRLAETFSYCQADRIHRVIEPQVPREERRTLSELAELVRQLAAQSERMERLLVEHGIGT